VTAVRACVCVWLQVELALVQGKEEARLATAQGALDELEAIEVEAEAAASSSKKVGA
jgi:hypothetical protein